MISDTRYIMCFDLSIRLVVIDKPCILTAGYMVDDNRKKVAFLLLANCENREKTLFY